MPHFMQCFKKRAFDMQLIDILREDFSQTLGFIDKCDNHIFQIKNWAIVTSSAIIAFSISQNHDALVFVNIPLLFAFAYLELIYKSFQDTAIQHTDELSQRIDKFVTNSEDAEQLVGYKHSFGRKLQYPSIRHVFSIFRKSNHGHIRNFYLLLAVISVVAFLLAKLIA